MNDGERTVPGAMRPAAQAASRARQRQLDAAVLTQSSRRPRAEAAELATPMIGALGYLVDAVMDLQGQVMQLETTLLQLADAGRLEQ